MVISTQAPVLKEFNRHDEYSLNHFHGGVASPLFFFVVVAVVAVVEFQKNPVLYLGTGQTGILTTTDGHFREHMEWLGQLRKGAKETLHVFSTQTRMRTPSLPTILEN
ncbi:hypothetical protein RUM44_008383 [Polyplax serrata]|uniref:Uncharacterized protein n=1 Tax=Polyplax serrata TaxID=468196 RepID=A0ABR1BCK5_POLSC